MQDGPLDHALETERRLGVDVVLARNDGRVFVDEIGQVLAQCIRLAAAGAVSYTHLDVYKRQFFFLEIEFDFALFIEVDRNPTPIRQSSEQ